ncbi:MAG: radical SAM family heme chaperone HemW [Sphingomonadales bacterium]|nr:radical SAM family heme chaperone HemW [Sphingomonadales bacterium]
MASVYFHVPFCRQACYYCDFHFSTGRIHYSEMVNCLVLEWEKVHHVLNGEQVNSIYLGGGTPSILPPGDIKRLIDVVGTRNSVRSNAEITLEVNPDDVSSDFLASVCEAGVNRLSIGIQSLNDESLRYMNRAHDSHMARQSLSMAQSTGFHRISVDLMFGLPHLTDLEWVDSLNEIANFGVSHISAYGLTLEPGTVWHRRVQQKKMSVPDEETSRTQYQLLMDFADQRGYRHYEVSNLALPGMESEHNSAYWKGTNYLGMGPSAHSYVDGVRWWNVSNNVRYMRSIRGGDLPQTSEVLTLANRHNEYVMTRLRMDTGIDLAEYNTLFGAYFGRDFRRSLQNINPDWVYSGDGRLILTREGRFYADGISASLFADDSTYPNPPKE